MNNWSHLQEFNLFLNLDSGCRDKLFSVIMNYSALTNSSCLCRYMELIVNWVDNLVLWIFNFISQVYISFRYFLSMSHNWNYVIVIKWALWNHTYLIHVIGKRVLYKERIIFFWASVLIYKDIDKQVHVVMKNAEDYLLTFFIYRNKSCKKSKKFYTCKQHRRH